MLSLLPHSYTNASSESECTTPAASSSPPTHHGRHGSPFSLFYQRGFIPCSQPPQTFFTQVQLPTTIFSGYISHCLADESYLGLSKDVFTVLLNIWNLPCRKSYYHKWGSSHSMSSREGNPLMPPAHCFRLLTLPSKVCGGGLASTCIKVHRAAISTVHDPVQDRSGFSHNPSKRIP